MKPIQQTIFGDKVGNCYAACIASLLEVPLDDVPNFCALPGDDWPQVRDAWFAERGLFTVNVIIGGPAGMGIMYQTLDCVPCILCGDSPRGPFKHCVVGEYVREGHTFRVVHDPHPDRAGLAGWPNDVTFIGVLNPAGRMAA